VRSRPACCPCNDLLLSRTSSSVRHKKPATSATGIPRAIAFAKNNRSALSQGSAGCRVPPSIWWVISCPRPFSNMWNGAATFKAFRQTTLDECNRFPALAAKGEGCLHLISGAESGGSGTHRNDIDGACPCCVPFAINAAPAALLHSASDGQLPALVTAGDAPPGTSTIR
jgi:hypothetical protein